MINFNFNIYKLNSTKKIQKILLTKSLKKISFNNSRIILFFNRFFINTFLKINFIKYIYFFKKIKEQTSLFNILNFHFINHILFDKIKQFFFHTIILKRKRTSKNFLSSLKFRKINFFMTYYKSLLLSSPFTLLKNVVQWLYYQTTNSGKKLKRKEQNNNLHQLLLDSFLNRLSKYKKEPALLKKDLQKKNYLENKDMFSLKFTKYKKLKYFTEFKKQQHLNDLLFNYNTMVTLNQNDTQIKEQFIADLAETIFDTEEYDANLHNIAIINDLLNSSEEEHLDILKEELIPSLQINNSLLQVKNKQKQFFNRKYVRLNYSLKNKQKKNSTEQFFLKLVNTHSDTLEKDQLRFFFLNNLLTDKLFNLYYLKTFFLNKDNTNF